LPPTIGMRFTHETVPDHTDFKCFGHNCLLYDKD